MGRGVNRIRSAGVMGTHTGCQHQAAMATSTANTIAKYPVFNQRTTPSSGELAVAYNFFGMRPAR